MHRGFGAAALCLPLTQHRPADILFFGNGNFNIRLVIPLYKKDEFAPTPHNDRFFRLVHVTGNGFAIGDTPGTYTTTRKKMYLAAPHCFCRTYLTVTDKFSYFHVLCLGKILSRGEYKWKDSYRKMCVRSAM